jgi:hypothetical protein
MEGLMDKGIRNGVNQAGKQSQDDGQIQVRFQNRTSKNPLTVLFMQILNAFGNIISPIKEDKKNDKYKG